MKASLLCALVLALLLSSLAYGNVLVNGDFEQGNTGSISNTPIPGWSAWGINGWHHNDGDNRTVGTKAMVFWWDQSGIYQDVSIAGGAELTYGVSAFNWSGNKSLWNLLVRMEFYSSAIGTAPEQMLADDRFYFLSASTPTDQWVEKSDTAVAPANADVARIVINMVDWFDGVGGNWNFDNAFVIVPEPSSLALLSLAGIVLVRRRTRSA